MNRILICMLVALVLFSSGCVKGGTADATLVVESIPQVQEFLEEHTNAEITAVLWSKDYIQSNMVMIKDECKPALKEKDYYKVDLQEGEYKITTWVSSDDYTVACFYKKNNHSYEKMTSSTKTCSELGGNICSPSDYCALSWMESSDSFCCPIECNKCTDAVLNACVSQDECTKASCGPDTGFQCKYTEIAPCSGNGICEIGEYEGELTFCNGTVITREAEINSTDCPDNCSDGDNSTSDFYNFTSQECEHVACNTETTTTTILYESEDDDCITLVEFNYDAEGDDNFNLNDEYLTIRNECSYILEMSGWRITDKYNYHKYRFASFSLEPDSEVTLHTGKGIENNSTLYWGRGEGEFSEVWNNDGDILTIRDSDLKLVFRYEY